MEKLMGGINPLNFKDPKIRTLHFSWMAFFISCLVWFNHAPLLAAMRDSLLLTDQQIKTLLILNVALTIPARIIVGMLVDKYGPRITFSVLLTSASILCFAFALADSFETLAITRFLLGFVGAGFVIGIRMVGEWFPAKQVGIAEGVYGGWGNFGSAIAAMTLPTLALIYGGEDGWRWAIVSTGLIALVYAAIYYISVRDAPHGATYFKPKKSGAMEVSSRGDFFLYIAMLAPMILALGLLTWKLGPANLGILTSPVSAGIYAMLAGLYAYQVYQAWKINSHVFVNPVPEIHRYSFRQVALLDLTYLVTFGSELAVVSMLPLFFIDMFDLTIAHAGILAGSFAFTNFFARPAGGWLSDVLGRKKSIVALLVGVALGYLVMSTFSADDPLFFVIVMTMFCSFFVTAGNGAVFAMVPIIKRRMTGQIAGQVGAYGNVGAVIFLTILSFVTPQIFFLVIAGAAVFMFVAILFIFNEPTGQIAEEMPDGTIAMIDVN